MKVQQEFVVFAMQRSGHHAVCAWIASLYGPESTLFLNDPRDPRKVFETSSLANGSRWDFEKVNSVPWFVSVSDGDDYERHLSADHECVIYNHEEFSDFAHFREAKDGRIQANQTRYVLVIRDLLNIVSSRLKDSGRHDWVQQSVREWKNHAKQALGNGLFDEMVVDFNRWFQSASYRESLASDIGVSGSGDRSVIPLYGEGSSFQREARNASELGVLHRWRECPGVIRAEVLRDEEAVDLMGELYPEVLNEALSSREMTKKVLFVVGEGIGNQIEALPAFVHAESRYGDVRVYNPRRENVEATRLLWDEKWDEAPKAEDYGGQIETQLMQGGGLPGIPSFNVMVPETHHEFRWNLDVVGADYDIPTCKTRAAEMLNIDPATVVDVVIHNGFTKRNPGRWEAKSYPHFRAVVEMIKAAGYSVGCVGAVGEEIAGAQEFTGESLRQSMAIMRGSKLVICTDSFSSHVCSIFDIPSVVVMTFTTEERMYDPSFSPERTIVRRRDLPCAPCQSPKLNSPDYWLIRKDECRWKCREIPPERIASESLRKLRADSPAGNKSLNNQAIVFVPFHNAERWIGKCIDSVLAQDYDDVGILVIDDASTDGSAGIVAQKIVGFTDACVWKNSKRTPKSLTLKWAISECCSNPKSVLFWLDGDDWLTSNTAVSEMMSLFDSNDIAWAKYEDERGLPCICGPLLHGNVREHKWVSSAPRAFRKFLFDAVKVEDLYGSDGLPYDKAVDQAFMLPMLEMAGADRRQFYNRILYHYTANPRAMEATPEGKRRSVWCAKDVRKKVPYRPLDPKEEIRSGWGKPQVVLVGGGGDVFRRMVNPIGVETCVLGSLDEVPENDPILVFTSQADRREVSEAVRLGYTVVAHVAVASGLIDHKQNGFLYEHPDWGNGWIEHALKNRLPEGSIAEQCGVKRPMSNGRADVTIVVPCYQQANFLRRCVESIATQTTFPKRVIVVDDGGTDDCEGEFERVKSDFTDLNMDLIKHDRNRGLSAARNSGFAAATTEWVIPLDCDDMINPEMIEKCIARAEDADVVYSDVWLRYEGRVNTMNFDLDLMLHRRNCLVCTALIRRSLWEDVGGYDESMRHGYEDWDFWLGCVERGANFVKQSGALFVYDNSRPDSMVVGARARHGELTAYMREKHAALYQDESSAPSVSVVVSAYNQERELRLFVESMRRQTFLPCEVIVADDGSSDGTLDWLDSLDNDQPFSIRYVTRSHEGYRLSSLLNEACRHASGERILLTNADVLHCPGSVEAHSSTETMVAGGVIIGIATDASGNVDEGDVADFNRIRSIQAAHPSARSNSHFIGGTVVPEGIWGGNFSIDRSEFEKTGGYDEGYDVGWGGEETDLVARMLNGDGDASWEPKSVGIHLDHATKRYCRAGLGRKRYEGGCS